MGFVLQARQVAGMWGNGGVCLSNPTQPSNKPGQPRLGAAFRLGVSPAQVYDDAECRVWGNGGAKGPGPAPAWEFSGGSLEGRHKRFAKALWAQACCERQQPSAAVRTQARGGVAGRSGSANAVAWAPQLALHQRMAGTCLADRQQPL